jgi:hypothetical protein
VCIAALSWLIHVPTAGLQRSHLDWARTVVLVSGLMWLTFSSVAQSMEGGTAIVSKVPIDPTINGPSLQANSFCLDLLAEP